MLIASPCRSTISETENGPVCRSCFAAVHIFRDFRIIGSPKVQAAGVGGKHIAQVFDVASPSFGAEHASVRRIPQSSGSVARGKQLCHNSP